MDVELATRYGQANQGSMDVAGRFGRKSNWMFVIIGASLLMITLMRFKPLCPDEVFAAGYGADSFPDRALLRTVDENVCKFIDSPQTSKYKDVLDLEAAVKSKVDANVLEKLNNLEADLRDTVAVPYKVCEVLLGSIMKPQCCAFAVAADADQSDSLDASEFKTLIRLLVRYQALIPIYQKCSGFGFGQCEAAGLMEKISETVRTVFYDLDRNRDNWLEQRELEGIFAVFGSAVSSPKRGWSERTFYQQVLHFTRSYPFLLDKDHNGVLDSKELKLVKFFFASGRCKNMVLWVSRVQTLPKLVSLDDICTPAFDDPVKILRRLGVLSCYEHSCGDLA